MLIYIYKIFLVNPGPEPTLPSNGLELLVGSYSVQTETRCLKNENVYAITLFHECNNFFLVQYFKGVVQYHNWFYVVCGLVSNQQRHIQAPLTS